MEKVKVGALVMKRWGKIEPEEHGKPGLAVATYRGASWQFVAVLYPFGVRNYRMTELEVINE